MNQNSNYIPTVTFNGLQLNQQAVDELSLRQIRTLRESKSIGVLPQCLAGLLFLDAAASILHFAFPDKVPLNPLRVTDPITDLCLAVPLYCYGRKQRKTQKEIDVLEFLKSGEPNEVRFSDTIKKAEQSGLRIG